MKCILMNKNTKVLTLEYDSELKVFTEIYEVNNIEYAPIVLKNAYTNKENFKAVISEWFKGRGIPSWRDDLDLLLAKLGITTPLELLDKAFVLSLSDQYWIKPLDTEVEYKDIHFFEHDFSNSEFTSSESVVPARSIASFTIITAS